MGEDFVLQDRSVVEEVDVFWCDGGDFRDHDTSECVCDGCVYADEVEVDFAVVEGLDADVEGVLEAVEVPGIVLVAGEAREVCGGGVCDAVVLDADDVGHCSLFADCLQAVDRGQQETRGNRGEGYLLLHQVI